MEKNIDMYYTFTYYDHLYDVLYVSICWAGLKGTSIADYERLHHEAAGAVP